MIIDVGDPVPTNIAFLRGFRAPPGGAQHIPASDTVTHEEVGTFVARSRLGFDGSEAAAGDIATADVPYDDMPDGGPFRYEADISAWKPEPDVIVVDDVDRVLSAAELLPFTLPYDEQESADIDAILVTKAFGTVEVDRGNGFGAPLPRNFGWLPRGVGFRLTLAGDAATSDPWELKKFDGSRFKLPAGYRNAFQNGGALPGENGFGPGDRLRFTDTTPIGPNVVTVVTVPDAPTLTVTRDGVPLDPPLSLTALVDTVVMDRGAQECLFLWRVTFPWEARFEDATLEVSLHG